MSWYSGFNQSGGFSKPWLIENSVGAYFEDVVEFEAIDESVFAPFIERTMAKHPGVWIKSMPKRYGTARVMRVWVSARGMESSEVNEKVKDAILSLEHESGLRVLSEE